MQFLDRQTAGKALAHKLADKFSGGAVVLSLPRGGVILGFIIAKSLDVPLGIVLVRKIGHPAHAAYAIAAVAEGEKPVYSGTEILPVDELWLAATEEKTRQRLASQRRFYFSRTFNQPNISGSTVILVDDGMATGLTMLAAAKATRRMNPSKIVVAVPVASSESIELVEPLVDDVLTLDKPQNFIGIIDAHYLKFPHVNDITVRQLLERSNTNGLRHTVTINS